MGLLDNKVVLVTVGAQGMGAPHVRKLVEEGATVMISDVLVDNEKHLRKNLVKRLSLLNLM